MAQLLPGPLPFCRNGQPVDCSLSLPLHRNTSRLIVALAPFKYSFQRIVVTIFLSLSCYAATANAGATARQQTAS